VVKRVSHEPDLAHSSAQTYPASAGHFHARLT
jgi:hypothetical protein